MISVITPIRDRIAGFNLCRKWVGRQVGRSEIEWIVVDDGDNPVGENHSEYRYIRLPPSDKKFTNHDNIGAGLDSATGSVAMYIEDDDWLSPQYVKNLAGNVKGCVAAALSGYLIYHIGFQRYVDHRLPVEEVIRRKKFRGAFCVAGRGIEMLRDVCRKASELQDPLVDVRFWKMVDEDGLPFKVFSSTDFVSIKGIPGKSVTWKHNADIGSFDRDEKYLRSLIGDDDVDAIVGASKGWKEWRQAWKGNLQKPKKRA